MKNAALLSLLVIIISLPITSFASSFVGELLEFSTKMSTEATTEGTELSIDGSKESSDSSSDKSKKTPADSDARVVHYVARNYKAIEKDISKGNGEALDALAELMKIPVQDREQFMAALQANFNLIYPTEKEDADAVVNNIRMICRKS